MRLRATISKFLLFSCVFCVVCGNFAMAADTQLASTSYVDSTIKRESGNVVIKNTGTNSSVTLSQNPQTTTVQTSSNKEVATIGWTDANRTSKVRSGGENGTTLVNMWIE
ncbi:MAG: hypothetical protein IJS34_01895 [Alphaproteobacteria bacterium]|nr:hypothetical protein [Alphaproteobacteria bacterium]